MFVAAYYCVIKHTRITKSHINTDKDRKCWGQGDPGNPRIKKVLSQLFSIQIFEVTCKLYSVDTNICFIVPTMLCVKAS